MEIVINNTYGGFNLSIKAAQWLLDNGIEEPFRSNLEEGIRLYREKYDIIFRMLNDYENRTYPLLVKCIETLGVNASGKYSDLRIEEVEGDYYQIIDDDGMETVITPNLNNFIQNKYA